MLLNLLAVITLGVTALLAGYLRWVPEAGTCPRCDGTTRPEPLRPTAHPHRLNLVAPVFRCIACGWCGRMRGGRVAQPVRGRGRTGGAS